MNTLTAIAGLAVAASAMTASAIDLDAVLCIDLSVTDMITITATEGLSASTVSGSSGTGFYFADFYTSATAGAVSETLISGDLSSAANASDGSPNLFTSAGSFGLNVWSYSADGLSSFTFGAVAFSGSATWSLDSDDYAAMLAGNTGGDIYAFADDDSDIPGASFIGTWKVVPAPSSAALLGLAGFIGACRRR